MKLIIFFLTLVLYTSQAVSQDQIILRNGDIIQAAVKEVGTDEIKYLKWNYPDGPLYVINKSEIFMISYKNGSKDMFNKAIKKDEDENVTTGETATLYFYRLRKLSGSATKIIVGTVEPDEVITKVKNGGWVKQAYTHPGERKFVTGVYSMNPNTFDYSIEPGKTYYIRCSLLSQGFKMMAKLELVSSEIASKEMKDLKQQTK